jgi:Tfp pilus assembly protein PilV
MNNRRPRANAGNTLIEVMFAVFLALVCAMIFAAAMPTAQASRIKADNYNRAVHIAQRQMESFKAVDPALRADQLYTAKLIDSVTPIRANTWSFTNVAAVGNDSAAHVLNNGRAEVEIELVDIELRRVTVRVFWTEKGTERQVTLATLVADLNN